MIAVLRAALTWVGRHVMLFALLVAVLLVLGAVMAEVRQASRLDLKAFGV